MNTTLKVARSLNHCWWLCGQRANHFGILSCLQCLPLNSGEVRHRSDHRSDHRNDHRITWDDNTQAYMDRQKKARIETAEENPWQDGDFTPDFKESHLDELGYESHCNDRLYTTKNKTMEAQREYAERRQKRRASAQERVQNHFLAQHEPENRKRSISQDPEDHQKRQLAIIEQNRRKWLSRAEAKREINTSGITYRPDFAKKEEEKKALAEEKSRRERLEATEEYQGSADWQQKKLEESQSKYWHSWQTCPSSREVETTEEVQPHLKRRKVAVHPPSYGRDNPRRSFHSFPSAFRLKAKTLLLLRKRRPSSLEKQFHKFAHKHQDSWLPQNPDLPTPDPANHSQTGMPLPNRLVPKKKKKDEKKPEKERRSVQPPVFRLQVIRQPAVRPQAPVSSYSGRPSKEPLGPIGPSEYNGMLRRSVSEAWRSFSKANAN